MLLSVADLNRFFCSCHKIQVSSNLIGSHYQNSRLNSKDCGLPFPVDSCCIAWSREVYSQIPTHYDKQQEVPSTAFGFCCLQLSESGIGKKMDPIQLFFNYMALV
jgi:hypothetical protein